MIGLYVGILDQVPFQLEGLPRRTGMPSPVRDGGRFFPKKSRKGWFNPERSFLLACENPLDPSHDVGANSYNITSVRRVFQHAYFTVSAGG